MIMICILRDKYKVETCESYFGFLIFLYDSLIS